MTTTIRIRKTLKGELNGRLLFFVDKVDAESEERNLFARRGVDGASVFGVTFYGLRAADEIILEDQACRDLIDMKLEKIGDYFGGKKHSTVMNALNKVEQDKSLLKDIELIKKRIMDS